MSQFPSGVHSPLDKMISGRNGGKKLKSKSCTKKGRTTPVAVVHEDIPGVTRDSRNTNEEIAGVLYDSSTGGQDNSHLYIQVPGFIDDAVIAFLRGYDGVYPQGLSLLSVFPLFSETLRTSVAKFRLFRLKARKWEKTALMGKPDTRVRFPLAMGFTFITSVPKSAMT